jgi:hypothetical protein
VVLDPKAGTYLLAYYIPLSSSDTRTSRTQAVNICLLLAANYQDTLNVIETFHGMHAMASGDDAPVDLSPDDAIFSRRVFIYHPDYFDDVEQGRIAAAFRKSNLEVLFRGPKYLSEQAIYRGIKKFQEQDQEKKRSE